MERRGARHADVPQAGAVVAGRAQIAVLARRACGLDQTSVLRIACAGEALAAAIDEGAAARAQRRGKLDRIGRCVLGGESGHVHLGSIESRGHSEPAGGEEGRALGPPGAG